MEILIRSIVLILAIMLFGHAEENVLINAHIRMIPKIMALNAQVSSDNTSKTSLLGIVYEGSHKSNAQAIADKINQYYNGKVANLMFNAVAISVDDLMKQHDIAFVYVTATSTSTVTRIGAWGISNTIPTFSYDTSALEHGILGSIAIERTTVIYINKNVLKAGKFRFNDTLFQIARLI